VASKLNRLAAAGPLSFAVFVALYPSLTLAQSTSQWPARGGRRHGDAPRARPAERSAERAAFTTADIEKQAFQGVEDVINALPSVNLVNSMPGRNSIVMRGVSTGSSEYRTDSQVAVYLDDQPLTSISQQVDIIPIDIERIEALPGRREPCSARARRRGRFATSRTSRM
jgi:hypothetical protein